MLNLSTAATAIKNRTDLKNLFKNKSRLSESQFAELIDSTLNKKEDKFYGVWQVGQAYSQGDVVYYQGVLWEAQADICAKKDEPPGTSANWKSRLKELEQKANTIEQNLITLNKEFTEYQQQIQLRTEKLLKYLTLLTWGIAIALLWLFGSAIFEVLSSAG